MTIPENTLPHDQEAALATKYVDLNQLAIRAIIEPLENEVLHVYSAPADQMVSSGDVLYRIKGKDNTRMYRVLYATTLRYPVSGCAKACVSLPYELFVKLEPITDEQEISNLQWELSVENLPY